MSDSAENPKTPGVVSYILSPSCDQHIEWLKNVFGARQVEMFRTQDKTKVMHVSMVVNDGILYLADRTCDMPGEQSKLTKEEEGENTRGFWCHVELKDPETLWKKALENGSTVVIDLKKQYYGGELGCFKDPFGINWGVSKAGDCRKAGVIPYIFLPDGDCEKHIEWMERALGAKRKGIHRSGNIIQHCVVEVNGAPVYMSDISGMPGTVETREVIGGKPKHFFCHMDVSDPQAVWDVTLKEGATVTMELKMQFWGQECGMMKDPFDFEWSIAAIEKPKAENPPGVIPYLTSPDCEKQVEWIKIVLGGEVKSMIRREDNKVMHCTIKVNEGTLFICDKSCSDDLKVRAAGEPRGATYHMTVADPDTIWKKALANGAVQCVELKMQFWGDYFGTFKDPFGFEWAVMKA